MPEQPSEPTNIVLEQLRLIRAEMSAMQADMSAMRTDITAIRSEMRGLKLNAIAEVYKANLTVASFADHERRIAALEAKNP